MSDDLKLIAGIERLKSEITDTRSLYQAVCALLFFEHGITPTGNRLYQYVRRGSLSVPVDEVTKFWAGLRKKASLDIPHPGIPDSVKGPAAEAIAAIWRQATQVARADFESLTLEQQAHTEDARAGQASAEAAAALAEQTATELRTQLSDSQATLETLRESLETERRSLAVAHGRINELLGQLEQARAQQDRQREAFSADLANARHDSMAAQERAAAAERRALNEIEQERQARGRADKVADGLRDKLGEAEARERRQSLEQTEATTRAQVELNAKSVALQLALEAQADQQRQIGELRLQLGDTRQEAARHQAEAQTLKVMVDRLTPPPPAPSTRIRRKAGSDAT